MPRLRLGVDLGGTKIEAIALDDAGATSWRERVPTPQGDYQATLDAIATLLARADAACGTAGTPVGIGTPGSVAATGTMKNANSQCLNGQPLPADLERRLQRPVRIANDANCLALSEATDGAAAGARVVFAVILGTGVGGGLVVDGQVHAGPNGLAGEWGHSPLPWPEPDEWPGERCYCGRRGCIETWLCGPGLAREHAERHGGALDAAQIAERAAGGDRDCAATLARHERRLARAMTAVVHVLDPDVIVLGGGLSNLPRLAEAVAARLPGELFGHTAGEPLGTRVVRHLHGDSSGVRGAAFLWP